MPNTCIVCGRVKGKGQTVSMHRFPADPTKKQEWLRVLGLTEDDITDYSRICSRHFLFGDTSIPPSLDIGKRFSSPKKLNQDRGKRALKRLSVFQISNPSKQQCRHLETTPPSRASSLSVTTPGSTSTDDEQESLSASIGEPLLSDFGVHELPGYDGGRNKLVDTALTARIEMLESQMQHLKGHDCTKTAFFRIEKIAENDSLIRFYTGFISFEILLTFFEFLGPAVHKLRYWGESDRKTSRRRKSQKLDPLNQLFLTLIKLRLNLAVKYLAFRFGISIGLVSKYFTTWVCFLYRQLKELNWSPEVDQVFATQPMAFKEKYPTTYCIIDASEVFIETPSDLFMQSSTWSNYKHHNTAKVLIGCTPNGVISFVSPLYVGGISDVELTKVSGFLDMLDGKKGVSVMADRGFTVRDLLEEKGVRLNIPPFMENRQQLPAEEVRRGRGIASLRIHVERAIGRIKNYRIIGTTFPVSMIRLADMVVSVCAWLTNFEPALVPPPVDDHEEDKVDQYFKSVLDSESEFEYDADSELTDEEESSD